MVPLKSEKVGDDSREVVMVKRIKAKDSKITKTMLKGLRPLSDKSRDDFSKEVIQKMREKIETILDKNQALDKKNLWLVNHILRVTEFRSANWEERDKIFTRINLNKKQGRRLGFTKKEMKGINLVVLQLKREDKLDFFIKKLKKKKEENKK